ncbi:hypothetical protein ACWIUD_08560 [Helicobacter sp. 23-1044]
MAKKTSKTSWSDFLTTENIEKGFGLISGGLGVLGGVKNMFFSDSSNESSSSVDTFALSSKINELEKENINLKYELLEAMKQTLIFRRAMVEMEGQLSGSFFAKLGNLFKSHKSFIGDKMDNFMTDNKELEKIISESYDSLKRDAEKLGVALPTNKQRI